MEHTVKVAYRKDDLEGLKRPELNRLAKKIGINDLRGKNVDFIDKMIKQSEESNCEYDDMGELQVVGIITPNERTHPVLGKYVKVVVSARDSEIKADVFANSHYQARIRMGDEITIPEGFVKFINSCHSIEHYYDETKFNPETGKYGLHTQRKIQDYFAVMV